MRALSLPVVFRNDGNAAAAALMAPSVSSLEYSGQVPMSLPLLGSAQSLSLGAQVWRYWWLTFDFKRPP